jgi:hypothetical protein
MSRGRLLYEAWQRACAAEVDPWEHLPEDAKEDWETFAMNLVIDHGLDLE